ncbi:MAG: DUF1810 domain-containing protein [Eubacteriales bacterium]|nr:DUF1810 domain-containing protein [Eubacteriales bacterium]
MAYNLERFLKAQDLDYETALEEIRSGQKQSHWMWYIFPQILGLGRSEIAVYYSIADRNEVIAYMENNILREHLLEISGALLELKTTDALSVMGFPDNLKLKSCMTLFAEMAPEYPIFQQVLDKYFCGEKDQKTLDLLKKKEDAAHEIYSRED